MTPILIFLLILLRAATSRLGHGHGRSKKWCSLKKTPSNPFSSREASRSRFLSNVVCNTFAFAESGNWRPWIALKSNAHTLIIVGLYLGSDCDSLLHRER